MTTLLHIRLALLALLLAAFTTTAQAQKEPRKSPPDSVMGKIGAASVKIKYGSPGVNSRTIYGDLVPYGKVWRSGANEATVFTTDKPLMVEGKPLAAGSYAFFTIPEKDGKWTVIFNKTAKQWGAYDYKEADDALRATVTSKKAGPTERLAYVIAAPGFMLKWADLEVPVSMK